MTELQWPPDRLGRLTPAQLACLLSKSPPGEADARCTTMAEALALADALEADEREWDGV